MKFAIYARVSTDQQSTDMQLNELRRYCESRGFEVYNEYIDHGVSGSKRNRPALDQLMDDSSKRKFDGVLVYRFDRFARSTRHLLDALETFRNLNMHFISYNENIDTSSPLGTAMFTICSAIAQLERDIIRERVRSGVRNARAQGKRLGRPQTVDAAKVRDLRSKGLSFRKIAEALGISAASVSTVLTKAS
jgi:DNA invertase Pin-like site-specific DNA recombinase